MANNDDARKETIECGVALAEDPQTNSSEPYSISPDGHYVGCDGYVVPKTFSEFYEREPLSVRRFVMKNLRKHEVDSDAMDMEQDLLLHLQYLPEKNKHREQGKTDIIQTFDPKMQYGASAKRFHNYISHCLTNRLCTLMTKRRKNPLFRFDTLSSTEVVQDDDGGHGNRTGEVSAEYVHIHSSVVAGRQERYDREQAHDSRIFVNQYKDLLSKIAPELLVVAEAISSTANSTEAQDALGISACVFACHLERLRTLMDCFQNGRDVQNAAQRRRRLAVSRRKRKANRKTRTVSSIKRTAGAGQLIG
ncbi:MAG: hypothetical protein WCA19_11715 [Candidatus Acidiferrales bacterium]